MLKTVRKRPFQSTHLRFSPGQERRREGEGGIPRCTRHMACHSLALRLRTAAPCGIASAHSTAPIRETGWIFSEPCTQYRENRGFGDDRRDRDDDPVTTKLWQRARGDHGLGSTRPALVFSRIALLRQRSHRQAAETNTCCIAAPRSLSYCVVCQGQRMKEALPPGRSMILCQGLFALR